MRALPTIPHELVVRILWPWSLLRKSMLFADLDMNDRRNLEVEIPAGNGVGTARAIARAYSAFAEGGAELGITPETLARLTAPPEFPRPMDEVMGVPSWYSLGFLRPGPNSASVRANARSERPVPEARSPSPIRIRGSATPT